MGFQNVSLDELLIAWPETPRQINEILSLNQIGSRQAGQITNHLPFQERRP